MNQVVEDLDKSSGGSSFPINNVIAINSQEPMFIENNQTWLKTGLTRKKSEYPNATFGGALPNSIPLSNLNANYAGGICSANNVIYVATDNGVVELDSNLSVVKTHSDTGVPYYVRIA